jgi:hypothetical protein
MTKEMQKNMKYGKLNLAIGSIGIIMASLGGIVLGLTYNHLFDSGSYAIDLTRALLKAAHTHGQPIAMYNLIFAMLIDRVALANISKRRASLAAAISMLLPVGMVLRGLTHGSMLFSPVAMVGVFALIISAGYLLSGCRELTLENEGR